MVIVIGFLAAIVVAVAVLSLPFLRGAPDGEALAMVAVAAMALVFIAHSFGAAAGVAVLVLIGVSEWRGWRDWLTYALIGGAVGMAFALIGRDGLARLYHDAMPTGGALALVAGAFAGAGIAYWLVAGRNAGRLLDHIAAERVRAASDQAGSS